MQALPRAAGGICARAAGSMAASMHQHAAWGMPVAFSISIAQRLSPPHRGQRLGSMEWGGAVVGMKKAESDQCIGPGAVVFSNR